MYYGESGASHKSPSHDESNLKVVQNLKTTYTPSHKVNIITSNWNHIIFLRDNRYTPLHYICTRIYGLVHPIIPQMHGQLTIFIFPYCIHKMHSDRFQKFRGEIQSNNWKRCSQPSPFCKKHFFNSSTFLQHPSEYPKQGFNHIGLDARAADFQGGGGGPNDLAHQSRQTTSYVAQLGNVHTTSKTTITSMHDEKKLNIHTTKCSASMVVS